MRRRAVSLLSVALAAVSAARLSAQATCTATVSCNVAVTLRLPQPNVVSLTISDGNSTVPTPSAQTLTAGFSDIAGPTIVVKANAPYRVTLQSAQGSWTYVGAAGDPRKPASDLLWSSAAAGPWINSTISGTLWPLSGQLAPATSGQRVALFYRTLWTWTTTPPGSYSLPVNITLTSP